MSRERAGADRRRDGPAGRGPGLAGSGGVPAGKAARPGRDLEALQFPNGSANLTYLLHSTTGPWYCEGRLSGGSRPAPTTWQGSTGCSPGSGAPSRPPRGPCCSATTRASSARLLRHGVPLRRGHLGRLPAAAASPGRRRRVGFAVVRALADLHQSTPRPVVSPTLAGRRASWPGRSGLARPLGRGGQRGRDPVCSKSPTCLSGPCPRRSAPGPAQRLEAGQLPVRSRRTVPGDRRLRLGHGHPWRPPRRPRHLLNYWPDPADRPATTRLPGAELLGLPTRAEVRSLRGAHRSGLPAFGWYEAFASWKTATVRQQLHARYLRGETGDERMASRGDRVAELASRARRLLGRSQL